MPHSRCAFRPNSIAEAIALANPGTTVRPAIPSDEPFLRALLHDLRAAEFIAVGLSGTMLATILDLQFRAQQAGYRQSFPQAEYLIIEHAGAPVGRLAVALETQAGGRTLHILDIALLAAARRRGVGADVIAGLERAAGEMRATRLTLSVARSNVDAFRLYRRLGFVALDGGDDRAEVDVAMAKALKVANC
jgi:ribosomal protein S18 acetylase RimI-like enzyme